MTWALQMPMTIANWFSAPTWPDLDASSGVARASVARYGGTRQIARPHARPAMKLALALVGGEARWDSRCGHVKLGNGPIPHQHALR